MKVRKGDTVIVMSGAHKGETGEVTRVLPDLNQVIVSGVNIGTYHRKPTGTRQTGGIEKIERPLHISNVTLVHPSDKSKGSRVGFQFNKDGTKTRVYRQAGNKEVK